MSEYKSLEHTIREISEQIGVAGPGGDKPQGTPKAFLTRKYSSQGSNQSTKNIQAAKGVAAKQAQQDPIKMESAPSDMSGVTLNTMSSESGKKKDIKETPAPNYGDAATVAQWPASEGGKKKKMKEGMSTMSGQGNEVGEYGRNVKEEISPEVLEQLESVEDASIKSFKSFSECSKGTIERRKVVAVGRPDTAENPFDPKSKLYKQGQIKTKIIDEETKKKQKDKMEKEGGMTPVDLHPTLKTPTVDDRGVKEEIRPTIKKEETEMSQENENPLIAAFFELQEKNPANMFEAAKKLSPKQKKIASVAGDKSKIDAADFAALRAGKKVEEESNDYLGSSTVTKNKPKEDPSTPKVPYSQLPKTGNAAGSVLDKAKDALNKKGVQEELSLEDWIEYHLEEGYDINDISNHLEENYQLDELSRKTLKSYQRKATTSSERSWAKADKEEDKSMSTDGTKYPEKQKRHADNAAKAVGTWRKREAGLKMAGKKLAKEEVEFSEAEIEYFNSVMEAGPVAKTDAESKLKKVSRGDRLGDTLPERDMTD